MWKRAPSFWMVLQLLLGVALVAVPVLLTGTTSLAMTVPIYLALVALTMVRETFQNKRQQRADLVRKLNILVSDFSTLTQGAHGSSVWAILRDLKAMHSFVHRWTCLATTKPGNCWMSVAKDCSAMQET